MTAGVLPNQLYLDSDDGAVRTALDTMNLEIELERPYYFHRVNLFAKDIILQALRQCASDKNQEEHKLEMLLNYIDAYYAVRIDFEKFANSISYNYDYLRHYFKKK